MCLHFENLVLSDCVYLLDYLVSTPSTWKDVSSSFWFAGYKLGAAESESQPKIHISFSSPGYKSSHPRHRQRQGLK